MGRNAKLKAARREQRKILDRHMTGMWVESQGVRFQYDPALFGHEGRKMMRERYLAANKHQGRVKASGP